MGLAQPKKLHTPEEYYALEEQAEYKSDYYKGEIFAMAGGTGRHSLICSNVIGEVRQLLKSSPCAVYESNLRIRHKFTGLRNYPDASVYCEPVQYDPQDPKQTTGTNPTVVFEVLSRTTERYDRGFKAENYRQINSLKAYLLISQDRPHVEMYSRLPGGPWTLEEVDGIDASLKIPPLGIDLPLAEIYARVDFTEPEPDENMTPLPK